MKLTSNEVNDIAKLATAAAQLLEATGIAPNGTAVGEAENLVARLCDIASQMATVKITLDKDMTPEQIDEFKRQWTAETSTARFGEIQAAHSIVLAGFSIDLCDDGTSVFLQPLGGADGAIVRRDHLATALAGLHAAALGTLNPPVMPTYQQTSAPQEPHYEKDDGPLTDAQIAAIRQASPASQAPDSSFRGLFDEPKQATDLGDNPDYRPAADLAAQLDGVGYGFVICGDQQKFAEENGLVIVNGASDDLMEFYGAFRDEIGAWEGTVALLDEHGLVTPRREGPDGPTHAIHAHWCDDPTGEGFTWSYSTDIPHFTFRMMDGDEKYCRGIVFALADLKQN